MLAGLIVGATVLAAGCGSSKPAVTRIASAVVSRRQSSDVTLPDTPAGAQARWLLIASAQLPIPEAQLRAHFEIRFLAHGPAALNSALEQVGAELRGSGEVQFDSIQVDQPRELVASLSRAGYPPQLTVTLRVDGRGRISDLRFTPASAGTPHTWATVDAQVRSVAPDVRMLVAHTTSGCGHAINSIDPTTASPLASAFKVYVLDALGNAVAAGKVSWNQPLTVTSQLKSLPSGELQTQPDGTHISVRGAADKLISISDNTAADMLIKLLGRTAVESTLTRTGMADPARDRPFLTPHELFILRLHRWPTLAPQYAAAHQAGRRTLLADRVDKLPLPALRAARPGRRPATSTASSGSPPPMTSAAPTAHSPRWPADRVSLRSTTRSRSTVAGSASIHRNGRPHGSREEVSQAS